MSASTEVPLEVCHASLEFNHLHVKCGLFAAECSNLLLIACILLFLMREVTLDVLFDLEQLVSKSLAHILSLQGQVCLQYRFFLAQTLHILFVIGEFILNSTDHILMFQSYKVTSGAYLNSSYLSLDICGISVRG